MDKIIYNFNVNGFNIKAEYDKRDIDGIFLPLTERLVSMRKDKGRRIIAYLAGPCGAGKTTAALLLEALSPGNIQAAGIDGFHYSREYLASNYIDKNGSKILMRDIKGSAETYDFNKLRDKISELKHGDIYWPSYDRIIHDVIADSVYINKEIIIIEGNWLLLDEKYWRELMQFCDYSIFISAKRETLIKRLTERKIMGGLSAGEAEKFVMQSDALNIERILTRRLSCDLEINI